LTLYDFHSSPDTIFADDKSYALISRRQLRCMLPHTKAIFAFDTLIFFHFATPMPSIRFDAAMPLLARYAPVPRFRRLFVIA
jgi:hypothetical protein